MMMNITTNETMRCPDGHIKIRVRLELLYRAVIISHGCFATLIVIANLLAIITLLRCRRLRRSSKIVLLNLSITDLLYGAVLETLFVITETQRLHGRFDCNVLQLHAATSYVLLQCSILSLAFVATDRYMSLFYPFKRHKMLTSKKATLICVSIWTLSVASSIFFGFRSKYMKWSAFYVLPSVTAVVFITILIMQIKIWILAYSSVKNIQKLQVGSAAGDPVQDRIIPSRKYSVTGRTLITKVLIILGLFTILPFQIVSTIVAASSHSGMRKGKIYTDLLWLLVSLNALLNPLCYCVFNRSLRKTFLTLIGIKRANDALAFPMQRNMKQRSNNDF